MAYYKEEKEDKVFIPKWEYRALRDLATRVDVLKTELEYEKQSHKDGGYDWELTVRVSMIERILGLDREKEYNKVEDKNEPVEAFGYTE